MNIVLTAKIKGNLKVYNIPTGLLGLFKNVYKPTKYERKFLPVLFDSENVTTDIGLNKSAQILGGLTIASYDRAAIGDRGINPSNLDVVLAPDPSDTALVNELNDKQIGSKSVTDNVLTLITTFLTAEGPFPFSVPTQEVVNEYGLKTSDGVLIARKTSASIPFGPSSRTGIILEWTLTLL